jgi:Putative regulator of cell autolysis
MLSKISKKLADMHLRTKLTLLVIGTMVLILSVHSIMYLILNRMTQQLDDIYVGNVRLNELEDALDRVESSMAGYLNTKGTDTLDEYYRAKQTYQDLLEGLEKRVTDNQLKMMERDIYNMSRNYLDVTESTIEAKRGRNIERYKDMYESAGKLYSYIKTYITSLNGYRFRGNTESYQALSSSLGYLEISSMISFVIMVFFDIMLVILVTGNITKPLNELAHAADKVSEGELDNVGVVTVHGNDEVGKVTVAFNQMVSSIPGYLSRLKESMEKEQLLKEKELLMEAHLKDAHLKYLQAQINPHFLFNTLNAGMQLATMERADRTSEYISQVAAFFRYNIQENDEVTLAQEIQLVDTYIYILNVRFSGEIHFKKDIESEELLNIRIPGMILQPLVENSVNYGIRDIERTKKIYLSVYRIDDNISISVMDNGVGMSQELIKEVLSGEYKSDADSETKKGNGVGLNNVIERLRLYFNGNDNFEIISNGRDQGTEVVITVPYTEE